MVKSPNLVRHHLAAGACMKAIAQYLKKNKKVKNVTENDWEVVGLLHDADYERTKDRPAEHGPIAIDEIRQLGFQITPEIAEAIKFHNKDNIAAQESLMGWGIYICDELTGLLVACALVRPDKKLSSVTVDFVLGKMKEPAFAKGALRERIYPCEEKLGIKLADFVQICLSAMQGIAPYIGL